MTQLVRSPLGYLTVLPKPSEEDLARHYRDKYYEKRDEHTQYAYEYTAEELQHHAIAPAEAALYAKEGGKRLFDVGFGEGFFLDDFHRRGWDVSGVDFTDKGLRTYFPHHIPKVIVGNVFEKLQTLAQAGAEHDLVVCNNVLEHVIDPEQLSHSMQRLLAPGGVCRIVVPNDASWLQDQIVERGLAKERYWLAVPDHLNYFNVHSLRLFLEATGWRVLDLLTTFPVDLFLLNPVSSYQGDREKGRAAHFAQVAFEVALYKRGIEELIAFRRGCASAHVGRNIIAYVTRS